MSDNKEKLLKAFSDESLGLLKRVIASQGSRSCNFYFVGDTRGSEAAVLLTKPGKDPTARGKALRKLISGSKFSRGTVQFAQRRLCFVLEAGNASASHMKMGFTRAYKKEKAPSEGMQSFQKLQKLLKKAKVYSPDAFEKLQAEDDVAPDDDTLTEADLADVSAEFSEEELKELRESAPALSAAQQKVQEAFLSQEAAEAELEEAIAESLRSLRDAESQMSDPASPEEVAGLQQVRYAVAESLYVGGDPFPEPGEPVAPEILATIEASVDSALFVLVERFNATAQRILDEAASLEDFDNPLARRLHAERALKEIAPMRDALDGWMTQLEQLRTQL